MRRLVAFASLAIAGLVSPVTSATSQGLTHRGTYEAWDAFTLKEPRLTACYAATEASEFHPSTPIRDRPVLYVVRYPNKADANSVELRFGFSVADYTGINAKVIARRRLKKDTFDLTIKNHAGFLTKQSNLAALIRGMRLGRELVILSQPGGGDILEDRFSLLGFTKALARIEYMCPGPKPSPAEDATDPTATAPAPGGGQGASTSNNSSSKSTDADR